MIERDDYSFWFLAPVWSVVAWQQLQFAAVAAGCLLTSWDQEAAKGGLMLMDYPSGLPAVGGPSSSVKTHWKCPHRAVSHR